MKVQIQEQSELSEAPKQVTDTISISSTGLLRLCGSKVSREARVKPGRQLAARICCTQGMSAVTRAYTPGLEVEQVLLPQDTMPTRVQAPFFRQTRGPPESPCRTGRRGLGSGSPGGLAQRPLNVVPRAQSQARQPVEAQNMHMRRIMKETSAAPVVCAPGSLRQPLGWGPITEAQWSRFD